MIPNNLPLLARGSHDRDSGYACIMNALSYMNGDKEITDFPNCTYHVLAGAAQQVNDHLCKHTKLVQGKGPNKYDDAEMLCAKCSHEVWMIGARLMGTAEPTKKMSKVQKRVLDVALGTFLARRLLARVPDKHGLHDVVEFWLDEAKKTAQRRTARRVAHLKELWRNYSHANELCAYKPVSPQSHLFSVLQTLYVILSEEDSEPLLISHRVLGEGNQMIEAMHELIDEFDRLTATKVELVWSEDDYRALIDQAGLQEVAQ